MKHNWECRVIRELNETWIEPPKPTQTRRMVDYTASNGLVTIHLNVLVKGDRQQKRLTARIDAKVQNFGLIHISAYTPETISGTIGEGTEQKIIEILESDSSGETLLPLVAEIADHAFDSYLVIDNLIASAKDSVERLRDEIFNMDEERVKAKAELKALLGIVEQLEKLKTGIKGD